MSAPEHPMEESLGSAFLHVTGIGSRLARRETAQEALDTIDDKMLTDLDRQFHERGEEAIPGLDLTALTKVDPEFSPDAFLLIARDTFRVMQDAHSAGAPSLDADIASAEVTAASLVSGREQAIVRFGIVGDTSPVTQDWTFERDPSVDSSVEDEQHEVADGGWTVAHRGWRLLGIAAAA
jgi:hypothetical protein